MAIPLISKRDKMLYASGFFQGATANTMMYANFGIVEPKHPEVQKANAELVKAMFRRLKLTRSEAETVIKGAIADSERAASKQAASEGA